MKWIICILLCLTALFTSAFAEGSGIENLPDEVVNLIADSRWSGWEITGWAHPDEEHGNDCAFVVVKNGKTNILLVFSHLNGAWEYSWHNANVLPQVEEPILLMDASGYQSITGEQKGIAFTSWYDVNNEIMEMACLWERQSNGSWTLNSMSHYGYYRPNRCVPEHITDASKAGVLHYPGARQKVYGEYQRELRYFNLDTFPLTIEEAREKLSAAPTIPTGALTAKKIKFSSSKKYPVYQGPDEMYGRAAGGKAAVSTNDWIQVFGEENGWIMIQYDISSKRYRIGWIQAEALPSRAQVDKITYKSVDGTLLYQADVTDDPLNSKEAIFSLPQGTEVTWLTTMGEWAYIEITTPNLLRGFVPISSIQVNATRHDIMASMAGYWAGTGGGEMFYDSLMLYEDGTYVAWRGNLAMEDTYELFAGQWRVTDLHETNRKYWNNPSYEIKFIDSSGYQPVFGLTIEENSMGLTTNEGGMGYEKCEPPVDDPTYEPQDHG